MSNNPFKLEFTLKQHTPLIHFQHDQEGATIRATELKPKLDKFILKNAYHSVENFIKTTSDGRNYLDYQVKISVKAARTIDSQSVDILNFSAGEYSASVNLVLANMGKQEHERKKFIFHDLITVEITCFNTILLDIIRSNFSGFLLRTNFGNRQSKGFGSFYLDESDPTYRIPNTKFYFTLSLRNTEQVELFSKIELFWKALRSGINKGTRKHGRFSTIFYFKSLVFLYAKSMGVQWEKKSYKECFFSDQLEVQKSTQPKSETLHFSKSLRYLMKDILGLSMNETWVASYNNASIVKRHVVLSENGENYDEGYIERFKSPITFKPIYSESQQLWQVFLPIDSTPSDLREAIFKISSLSSESELELSFPPDWISALLFFNFLFIPNKEDGTYKFNLENHVEEKYKVRNEWKTLCSIILDIRKNIPND